MQKTTLKATLSVNGDGQSSVPSRCRAPSVGIDVDMVSEFDPSSSDSGVVSRCAVVKPLKLRLCQPIFGRRNLGKLRREHGDVGRATAKDDSGIEAKSSKSRDPEREEETGEEEGEASYVDTRLHNGQLYRMLATIFRPLHRETIVPGRGHTDAGIRHRVLVGLHELRPKPVHLHCLQQGLPARVPQDTVQMSLRPIRSERRRVSYAKG